MRCWGGWVGGWVGGRGFLPLGDEGGFVEELAHQGPDAAVHLLEGERWVGGWVDESMND